MQTGELSRLRSDPSLFRRRSRSCSVTKAHPVHHPSRSRRSGTGRKADSQRQAVIAMLGAANMIRRAFRIPDGWELTRKQTALAFGWRAYCLAPPGASRRADRLFHSLANGSWICSWAFTLVWRHNMDLPWVERLPIVSRPAGETAAAASSTDVAPIRGARCRIFLTRQELRSALIGQAENKQTGSRFTDTYCLPFTEYVMGPRLDAAPTAAFQKQLTGAASRAKKYPSRLRREQQIRSRPSGWPASLHQHLDSTSFTGMRNHRIEQRRIPLPSENSGGVSRTQLSTLPF